MATEGEGSEEILREKGSEGILREKGVRGYSGRRE